MKIHQKNSADKEAVKKLFYAFTDMEFDSYLGTCMKKITRRKNTRINYLYRDASNYKKYNEVIIPGTFTEEQIHTFELSEDGFEETEAKATCYISPEYLVELFLERKKAWQDEFYVPADWL